MIGNETLQDQHGEKIGEVQMNGSKMHPARQVRQSAWVVRLA
jgi:hypothetical protein